MVKLRLTEGFVSSNGDQKATASAGRRFCAGVMPRASPTSLQAAASGSANGSTRLTVREACHCSSHVRKSKTMPSVLASRYLFSRGT